ncbi:EcsC family protein [Nonomuraea bangladeshensis]|uniref:EcsC family protein n=1 Tax=Nonomuraea bangladeshensis TaxID=404385 RepID=UPI003C2C7775
MSDYETRAWSTLLDTERKRRNSTLVTKRAGGQVREIHSTLKVMNLGDETIVKALEGGLIATFLPAMRSASLEKRVERLRHKHQDLSAESPFKSLDLKDLDKGRPTVTIPFIGMLQASVASVVVTGASVSTTVSGGMTAKVAVIAVASDVVISLALLSRAVAEVAVHYGYDPREPEEELVLMEVLNYSGVASLLMSKTAALVGLSRLTQMMMRRATWKQLGKEPLVRVVLQIFKLLEHKLTKAQLANVVPIAGVILTAGLSFNMLYSAIDDATRLYRARYLAEKHGLSWEEWLTEPMSAAEAAEAGPVADGTAVEIDGLLDEVIAAEEAGYTPPATDG